MLPDDKKRSPASALLVVPNLDAAMDFYYRAFGALEAERYADPDRHVWYAVIDVLGAPLQLMEPFPDMGLAAGNADTDTDQIRLIADVPEVPKAFDLAGKHGAAPITEPAQHAWGTVAEVRDPFGHRWQLGSQFLKTDRRRAPIVVDVAADDLSGTVAFFAKVFGATDANVARGFAATSGSAAVRIGRGPVHVTQASDASGLKTFGPEGRPGGDISMLTVSVPDVKVAFRAATRLQSRTIVEPQVAYWGDLYSEFRLPEGLRVASCGEQSVADIVDPADAQRAFRQMLEDKGTPVSPAEMVGAQNV